MRRREQPIDDMLASLGRFVGEERGDFGGRGRQADQVERHAAEQGPFIRRGRGSEVLFFELFEDERVDRIADPGCVFDGRRAGIAKRLEAPPIAAGAGGGRQLQRPQRAIFRPGGA